MQLPGDGAPANVSPVAPSSSVGRQGGDIRINPSVRLTAMSMVIPNSQSLKNSPQHNDRVKMVIGLEYESIGMRPYNKKQRKRPRITMSSVVGLHLSVRGFDVHYLFDQSPVQLPQRDMGAVQSRSGDEIIGDHL